MIYGTHPLLQTLYGTLFTWFVTALGAGLVFFLDSNKRFILDWSLGFSAGVMLAASYWSLLEPAISAATDSGLYGNYSFVPVAFGFLLGGFFIQASDWWLNSLGASSDVLSMINVTSNKKDDDFKLYPPINNKRTSSKSSPFNIFFPSMNLKDVKIKRIMLLLLAITVHNFPEGMAVGAGFATANNKNLHAFEKAKALAFGIGIQNFPEGLAVSLPLAASGFSKSSSFWYGQLSGLVEPFAGLLGCFALSIAQPLLPWALAFAAGAMVYVVIAEIVPEMMSSDVKSKAACWMAMFGFVVMMSLDVGLSA